MYVHLRKQYLVILCLPQIYQIDMIKIIIILIIINTVVEYTINGGKKQYHDII